MTKLHGVQSHPFRRTLPRVPKRSHVLWTLAVGLLLLAVLTFWSHSAAADDSTSFVTRVPASAGNPQ